MKQLLKLLQEEHSRLQEHNCYRTLPCLALSGEEKAPPGCLAHWPGAVLLIWGTCLIPGTTTAGSLHLLIWQDQKGGKCSPAASQLALDVLLSICAWNCLLDESTDCSDIEQCEGEYCVKLSSLGMYVVQFFGST